MEVKKIAHCADIHIRKLHRFVEYREVFDRFYKQLEELEPDIIYIGGDVVHGKLDTSPEETRLVADFLLNLSNIAKTVVIPGNHDVNLNNKSREDVLSPIVDLIRQINPNIEYWKESGVYTVGDVDFGVLSIFDIDKEGVQQKHNLPKAQDLTAKTKIALFHGTVGNYEVDNGLVMSDDRIKISDFNGYDMVLLGDIHKRQALNDNKTIAYPGSLIQQNFSEDPSHGFLLWDVEKRTAEYHQVKNTYGYKTIDIIDGVIQNKMSYVPEKGHIRIRHTNTSIKQIKDIKLSLHKKYPRLKSIKTEKVDIIQTTQTKKRVDIGDVRDIQYQNKLLKNFFDVQAISDEQLLRILDINQIINNSPSVVKGDVVRNIDWKIKSLKFDNMFSYAENNYINFEKLDGAVGLVAPNHSGKSALIDSIAYALFDVCSRTTRAVDILNKRKSTFKIIINIEVDGVDYYIERVGKYRKRVSKKYNTVTELCPVTVKFYSVENGEEVNLAGAARKNTQYGAGTNENIKNLLGTFDDFILTAMSLQSNGANFIDKRQHERKSILSQFLDINIFDQLYDIARKDVQEEKILLKRLQDEDLYTTIVNLDNKIDTAVRDIKTDESKEDDIISRLQQLQEEKLKLASSKYKLEDDDITSVADLEETMHITRKELLELDEQLKNDLEYKETLRPLYNRYNDKLSDIDEDSITNQLQEATKRYQVYEQLKQKESVYITELDTLTEKLKHLEKYKYDPDCKFCITNGKRQIEETTVAREKINKIKNNISIVESKLSDIGDILSELKESQQNQQNYNILLDEINQIKQDSFKLANRITDKQGQVKLLQSTITNTQNLITQYNKNAKKIEHNKQVTDKLSVIDNDIITNQDKLDSHKLKLDKARKYIQSLDIERSQVDKSIKTMVDIEQRVNDYELYLSAVCRDGIPFELISTTITTVEQEINDVLDNMMVGFTMKLEMEDKNILAKIQYAEESWPLELCSGMEKFVSSLAIRIGLINISTLPRPNFIIVDEGFGTLDSENIGNMKSAFEYLKTQFDFILIVTHLDTIKDYMDYLIPIEVDNGYSKVNLT